MANRTLILIAGLLACCFTAKAQTASFQQVDSTSLAQYKSAQWAILVAYGNKSITSGVDYPVLRLRMAYALFVLGNYSGALVHYQKVLNEDSRNQIARYFSSLCNKYLNRDAEASYLAGYIDTITLNKYQIKPFGALQAGVETSVKVSGNTSRGTGSYTRGFLSNRLGWHVTLDQSIAYYNQSITSPATIQPTTIPSQPGVPAISNAINTGFSDSQFEYYAKLSYTLNSNFILMGAYHYFNTSYGTSAYQNYVGLIGMRFSTPYFTLQGDADLSNISNSRTQQYNGVLTLYPMGNLNLYTVSRISVQGGDVQQTIFSQSAGFKVIKHLWLEASAGFGKMDNYLEADALYVYNSIDITKFKSGLTGVIPVGQHAIVYINYLFEQKQDYYITTNYNQNSITGGITWKF